MALAFMTQLPVSDHHTVEVPGKVVGNTLLPESLLELFYLFCPFLKPVFLMMIIVVHPPPLQRDKHIRRSCSCANNLVSGTHDFTKPQLKGSCKKIIIP